MSLTHRIVTFSGGGVYHKVGGLTGRKVLPVEKRGEIEGLSIKSRTRLKAFLLAWTVDGAEEWAVTLTIHHPCSFESFRSWFHTFVMRVNRLRVGLVWRIELQRRGVPHLHCVVWVFDSRMIRKLEWVWLEVCEMVGDEDAELNACKSRPLEDGGWYGYLILHNTKAKQDQLGWRGRQWGVVNRRLFSLREEQIFDLTFEQYGRVRKLLNRIYKARGRKKDLPSLSSWQAVGEDRFTVASVVRFVLKKEAER